MKHVRTTLFAAATLLVSGCAYKPLKAPCGPDEGGTPLAYADAAPRLASPEPVRTTDRCGPMRPI